MIRATKLTVKWLQKPLFRIFRMWHRTHVETSAPEGFTKSSLWQPVRDLHRMSSCVKRPIASLPIFLGEIGRLENISLKGDSWKQFLDQQCWRLCKILLICQRNLHKQNHVCCLVFWHAPFLLWTEAARVPKAKAKPSLDLTGVASSRRWLSRTVFHVHSYLWRPSTEVPWERVKLTSCFDIGKNPDCIWQEIQFASRRRAKESDITGEERKGKRSEAKGRERKGKEGKGEGKGKGWQRKGKRNEKDREAWHWKRAGSRKWLRDSREKRRHV